jgi:3-dehydroquinate dehydratase-1
MIRAQTKFAGFLLGGAPRVVGTVSKPETLAALDANVHPPCDIVELRLDLTGVDADWPRHAREIERAGLPVILTVRLAAEGGNWTAPDDARAGLFQTAAQTCSAMDIELGSVLLDRVSALAVRHGRALIVSCHDFHQTPPLTDLKRIMVRAANYGTIVKIATFTKTEDDMATLRALFSENCSAALCILGMGPLAQQTRTEFPRLGSCFTYGYLDEPVAPGQPAASDLMRQLRTA